jgi:hypothetical protein
MAPLGRLVKPGIEGAPATGLALSNDTAQKKVRNGATRARHCTDHSLPNPVARFNQSMKLQRWANFDPSSKGMRC